MKTKHLAIVIAVTALAGCSAETAKGLADRGAPTVTSAFLVGYWIPEGGECESDGGVNYKSDGAFVAYDISGTWRLEGDRLVSKALSRGEPDEPDVDLDPPEESVSKLRALSKNELVETWADGSAHKLTRCA